MSFAYMIGQELGERREKKAGVGSALYGPESYMLRDYLSKGLGSGMNSLMRSWARRPNAQPWKTLGRLGLSGLGQTTATPPLSAIPLGTGMNLNPRQEEMMGGAGTGQPTVPPQAVAIPPLEDPYAELQRLQSYEAEAMRRLGAYNRLLNDINDVRTYSPGELRARRAATPQQITPWRYQSFGTPPIPPPGWETNTIMGRNEVSLPQNQRPRPTIPGYPTAAPAAAVGQAQTAPPVAPQERRYPLGAALQTSDYGQFAQSRIRSMTPSTEGREAHLRQEFQRRGLSPENIDRAIAGQLPESPSFWDNLIAGRERRQEVERQKQLAQQMQGRLTSQPWEGWALGPRGMMIGVEGAPREFIPRAQLDQIVQSMLGQEGNLEALSQPQLDALVRQIMS